MSPAARIDAEVLQRRVQALPALPRAALDALEALRDDGLDLSQCAETLARDPALAAGVLRLANSPFYGVPGRVARVHDAVLLLGRRMVSTLATAALAMAQFAPPRVPAFGFEAFWRHAIAVALAARALARELRQDEDVAFTAGLLHDIGRLALATLYPQPLAQALAWAAARDVPDGVAEHELLGVDHAALGRLITTHWRLPATVAQAIGGHHGPFDALAGPTPALVVHMADAMAHALDLESDARERVPELAPPAAAWVAMQGSQLLPLLREVETGVQALGAALGLRARTAPTASPAALS
ncbi:HDOD domain-containing protein [Azohydromonas aeria]|uniref:HDOD domain-containing protein n=1 Tax=Azohydromonas aeria TaxID=2590212 RepID=UPI0012F7E986|nr:HDOD domain-containing protein [Azohydromonas aeria]